MEEAIKTLYGPDIEFVDGNFVERIVDGKRKNYFGWIDNDGNITLPRFDAFKKAHNGRAPPELEYVQGLMQLSAAKHEHGHKENPKWSEGMVEASKLKSLIPDSDEEMVNLYLHQKRLRDGGEEAKFSTDTLGHYNFKKRIARYLKDEKLRERYEEMGYCVDMLLGIKPMPGYLENGKGILGMALNYLEPLMGQKPARGRDRMMIQ
jgi:hypothetical protein